MSTGEPPTYNFAGLQFNDAFFNSSTTTDGGITPAYAKKQYLARVGAPNSIATDTTFLGNLSVNSLLKTNNISAIGTVMNIGKSKMLGQLDMNSQALNNTKDIFGDTVSPMRFITSGGQEIQYLLDGVTECSITSTGLNMNNNSIYNSSNINGISNTNFPISALGTGHLQLFSNAINRLTFRDTGECLANSNGLYIQGTTNATSQLRIGYNSSAITQGNGSLSLGGGSGTIQGTNSIAVGSLSGINQGNNSISIGNGSGGVSQVNSCIALGTNSGRAQSTSAIAIGTNAGTTSQGVNCIAIGNNSGRTQGNNAISIGVNSATNGTQGTSTVAIGDGAGGNTMGDNSVSIGLNAGNTAQGTSCVAIGQGAGQNHGIQCISLGYFAGAGNVTKTGNNAIAIGTNSATVSQGQDTVAIGNNAGYQNQQTDAIAIGRLAGYDGQQKECIAIGTNAGNTSQGVGSVNENDGSVAIGTNAGKTNQRKQNVAIGGGAGQTNQGIGWTTDVDGSVAIGFLAGKDNQPIRSVAVGAGAGRGIVGTGVGSSTTAIGWAAGVRIGQNSTAIGAGCASTLTLTNSIFISGMGAAYNPTGTSGFYVNPGNIKDAIATALHINGQGEITRGTSSMRYKKDIEYVMKDTSVIHKLKPATFRYKTQYENTSSHYGFIAEDIEYVDRNLVIHTDEGLPDGLYWERIHTYNICEVQKLRKELDETKNSLQLMKEEMLLVKNEMISMKNVLITQIPNS